MKKIVFYWVTQALVGFCRVPVAFLNLNSIPAINPKIYNKAFDALIVRIKRGLYIFILKFLFNES